MPIARERRRGGGGRVSFAALALLTLLTLLLLWLFLFLREYWLYLHAWRHITERQLIRLGFFGTRKGVLR
jgi:hypothetical protein